MTILLPKVYVELKQWFSAFVRGEEGQTVTVHVSVSNDIDRIAQQVAERIARQMR